MPTPSFEQIKSYSLTLRNLATAAISEFLDKVPYDATVDEVRELAYSIGRKYKLLSSEIGAQWYDWCAQLAGVDVEPAEIVEVDDTALKGEIDRLLDSDNWALVVDSWMQDMVSQTARQTGHSALWRDYQRGMAGARWARVPVGETCAWCLMLASQGAWYHSEETALGAEPDHYHSNCDCIAVFYADADDIAGYDDLLRYKEMYYEADNMRLANAAGRSEYPEELAQRIEDARRRSDEAYPEKLEAWKRDKARGVKRRKPRRFDKYNEDMILMRWMNGLEH